MSPLFHGADDGEHLLIVDLVVPFHRRQGFRQERNRMPVPILWVLLGQNCACYKVQTISFNPEGPGVVQRCKDWSGGNQALKSVKG